MQISELSGASTFYHVVAAAAELGLALPEHCENRPRVAIPPSTRGSPGKKGDRQGSDRPIATSGSLLDLRHTTVDKVVVARDPLPAIGYEEGDHLGDFRRLARTA